MVDSAQLAAALGELNVAGRSICVHASLRSFGGLPGGPDSVMDAVLDAGATLLVPSSSFRAYLAPKPNGAGYPFNAEDDGSIPAELPPGRWDPDAANTDPAMGSLPAAVLARPGRLRGDHPLSSFTALGPSAGTLVAGQRPLDVYAPLRELAEGGGLVIGMGVGLDTITLLHLAERQAGLRLLRRWASSAGGVLECEHGGCSRGFERLADAVADVETTLVVGSSHWRVWPAKAMLDRAVAALRRDPGAATCSQPGCARCRDLLAAAAAGSAYPPEVS
jgi:aminoglycoside 3-N-acetyltransferase